MQVRACVYTHDPGAQWHYVYTVFHQRNIIIQKKSNVQWLIYSISPDPVSMNRNHTHFFKCKSERDRQRQRWREKGENKKHTD